MNRIFVCGDTHGIIDLAKVEKLCEREKLDFFDYVIICGDCGVVFDKDFVAESVEKYKKIKTNILFVDGNHENFDLLKNYKVETWNGGKIHKIDEHIIHLMRGQVFEILGKKIFTLGGANSTDKELRTEHFSWWQDEEITVFDIEESFNNLKKYNNEVDVVITHTPPTTILNKLYEVLTQCGEDVPYYLQKKIKPNTSSDFLDIIESKIKYKNWYCGHLHTDEIIDTVQILYGEIVKIN